MGKMKKISAVIIIMALVCTCIPNYGYAAKGITVKNAANKMQMAIGSTYTLVANKKANKLTFSSSNSKVATVAEDGTVTARKKGNAKITVKFKKAKAVIKVKVKKPVGYTINRTSGNYPGTTETTVKVKKGYKVYYAIGAKYKTSSVLNANESKTFIFSKTAKLKLFAVKKNVKMSAKKLNAAKKNDNSAEYTYTIGGSNDPNNPNNPNNQGSLVTPGPSQYTGDDSKAEYKDPIINKPIDDTDKDAAVDLSKATVITLPQTPVVLELADSPNQSYEISSKNKLTIRKAGTYAISTEGYETKTIMARIEVKLDEAETEDVRLILNGVNMSSAGMSDLIEDTGIITCNKRSNRVIITLPEGIKNVMKDDKATGFVVDEDTGEVTTEIAYPMGILCKKVPLTINGKGSLDIITINGTGIKATETLKIIDSTINVSGNNGAPTGNNGISGKYEVQLINANLNVYSNGDAVKTTLGKKDVEEDSSLAEYGNITVDGGNYKLKSSNSDGIDAFNTLNLKPDSFEVSTENKDKQTADASFKAIKAGTTILIPEGAGTIIADTSATMTDGRSTYADDTIHCDGYIEILGGDITLKAGDDGIHADSGLSIGAPGQDNSKLKLNVTQSYEGIEAADITINSGTVNVVSSDDGMNAAGGSNQGPDMGMGGDFFNPSVGSTANYQLIINGGDITVNAGGDGIDSNGNLYFKGGDVKVDGPTNSGNGALDYGDRNAVCEISGGTLYAAGASGMDVGPTNGSSQPAVKIRLNQSAAAGTIVQLVDSTGKVVMSAQPKKQFQSIVMSCEALELNKTYTIKYGTGANNLTEFTTVTFTSASMSVGSSSGGIGGPGGPGGNWRPW